MEMAIVAPVLLALLFGTIEAGLMAQNTMTLNELARQAARGASRGWTPSRMDACIDAAADRLDLARLTRSYEYRRFDEDTNTWGSWTALGSLGPFNNARDGDRVRVQLSYRHKLVSGRLFEGLLGDAQDGSVTLSASVTLRHE